MVHSNNQVSGKGRSDPGESLHNKRSRQQGEFDACIDERKDEKDCGSAEVEESLVPFEIEDRKNDKEITGEVAEQVKGCEMGVSEEKKVREFRVGDLENAVLDFYRLGQDKENEEESRDDKEIGAEFDTGPAGQLRVQ
jgi:hypothetical protein